MLDRHLWFRASWHNLCYAKDSLRGYARMIHNQLRLAWALDIPRLNSVERVATPRNSSRSQSEFQLRNRNVLGSNGFVEWSGQLYQTHDCSANTCFQLDRQRSRSKPGERADNRQKQKPVIEYDGPDNIFGIYAPWIRHGSSSSYR